jgi:putative phosphoribosyl transferase
VSPTATAPKPFLQAGAREAGVGPAAGRVRVRLAWPCHPSGFVLLVRVGNGDRLSEDEHVAGQLAGAGIGTAMIDLGPRVADSRGRSDAGRLADKVHTAVAWLRSQPEAAGLPVGCYAAGVAGAAVLAAAAGPSAMEAVVVRGGRPDLVENLGGVTTPTLLLVGSRDEEGMSVARAAPAKLGGPKRLATIRSSGRRFADAGALDGAGRWAAAWFVQHLAMERTWRAARSGAAAY